MGMRFSMFAGAVLLLTAVVSGSCDNESGDPGRFYPPDGPGSYDVGVTTLYAIDENRFEIWGMRDRTLPLEVWYPSTTTGGRVNTMADMIGDIPPAVWSLLEIFYGDYLEEFWNTPTSAMRDVEVLISSGPFPVLFFSHGFAGLRFQNYTLSEHLASHGFVVISADHYGNAAIINLPDGSLIPFNPFASFSDYFERIEDVEFVYNELQRMNQDVQNPWYGLFDLETFSVIGHSAGGLTSIYCGANFDFVKAIAPLNPVPMENFPQSFSKPFYMLQGENDTFVGFMNEDARKLLDDAASVHKVHINLINGGHYNATDVCLLAPPSIAFLKEGCDPPNIDYRSANRISNAYMTAFFKSALLGDHRYDDYLKENHFPGEVELTTTWE